ncbi:MAG: CBS domain-containing protein [Nitrospirae bacterium]|nr:CBS domain-containing protein [Nitrospirota bacterium]
MRKRTTTRPTRRLSLDRNIERLRQQLDRLAPFLSKGKGRAASTLDEFDLETERLIREVLGETSEFVEAYEYAQLGEAASLVNVPEEAQEGGVKDTEHESLHLRRRVLESCIAELEARRAAVAKKPRKGPHLVIGPQVTDYMTPEIRSVDMNATLKEAGRLMQEWKVGSLLVTDGGEYVGVITDTDLARDVVARGLDSSTTTVKACMRQPPITIEGDQPIIEAVRLMKDKATRHLAVTEQGEIIGVISVSNILRYYSGVV